METLEIVAVSVILIVLAVHVVLLIKWWPVFDDPDYFKRQEMEDRLWAYELRLIAAQTRINEEATL
jgi:hypothetical protein